LIEALISHKLGRPYEMHIYHAIPYLSALGVLASAGILFGPISLGWISWVLLVEMAVCGIVIAISVGLDRHRKYVQLTLVLTRRRLESGLHRSLTMSLIAAGIAFAYSIWFFAVTALFTLRFTTTQLANGPATQDGLRLLWPSIYYSASTIAQSAAGFSPIGGWAQAASLAETYVGILFFVFVIAALAARLAPTRQESA
jgi:hypothetical protein